jgi:hypothetical protein
MALNILTPLYRGRMWTQTAKWYLQCLVNSSGARRSKEFWKANKGQFAGRRGFVIGNGPSLTAADLTLLKDDVSIASNRINLIYPDTPWRPLFVTVSDPLVWAKHAQEICASNDQVVTTSNLFAPAEYRHKVNLSRAIGPCINVKHGFTTDHSLGSYSGYTVTFLNLQIAAHLGLNPIYIIGCDHYYGTQQHSGNTLRIPKAHEGERLHFHKDYRKAGEVALSAPIDLMNAAYDIACRELQANGFEVYNATRGGYLEAFPRVELDSLFSVAVQQ